MQTSTWLKHGDRSPAWVVKKRVRLHFLCTLQERALCSILWNASIDYISQIKVKHLEKPAQHLSIFISITSRCNSLSLHCWCGMNWFICHLLVKKFNFDVVCIFFTNDFFTTRSGVRSCGPFSLWIVNVREEIIVNGRGFNLTATSVSEGLWTDGGFFILPAMFYFLSPPFFALPT